MIRSSRRIASLAALTGAASLFPWKSGAGTAGEMAPPQPRPQALHLRTDGLPAALVIPGDPLKRAATSFELLGELPPAGDGKGLITFDETRLTFNDFGDATPVGGKRAVRVPVVFRRIQAKDPAERGRPARTRPAARRLPRSEGRRVYELVFPNGALPHQLRIVIGGEARGPHRLLVARPGLTNNDRPVAILDLHGPEGSEAPRTGAPLRSPITLMGWYSAPPGRLCRLTVRGALDGSGTLLLDRNDVTCNAFGDPAMSTLVAYPILRTTLKRIETQDPARKGRRLFEIKPIDGDLEERYFLVLWPTDMGPHRLLIRQGETLRQLLPLINRARQR